jgi:hypothetical protein
MQFIALSLARHVTDDSGPSWPVRLGAPLARRGSTGDSAIASIVPEGRGRHRATAAAPYPAPVLFDSFTMSKQRRDGVLHGGSQHERILVSR